MPTLTLADFVARWKRSSLSESSGSQQHFLNLCELLGEPHPAAVDQSGEEFTFEKGGTKAGGTDGWADVWKRGHFGWEYKGKHKDLLAAYQQLVQYKDALENPPLLIVCDFERFVVRTNFTNTATHVFSFTLDDLLRHEPTPTCARPPLDVLRAAFSDPNLLKPSITPAQVTETAAKKFSVLAESLRTRGVPSERAAHFLMRLLFCLFAEDVGLLPDKLFAQLIQSAQNEPAKFTDRLKELFRAMSAPGGHFGVHDIPYFNGGLFSDDEAFDLTGDDLRVLAEAVHLDWGSIEPAIFGTLFERSLDPDKRSQLGAHYTSEQDINLIIEPVLMAPLRRRWAEVKEKAAPLSVKIHSLQKGNLTSQEKTERTKAQNALRKLLGDFLADISAVKVLDPACGSGNFLYVALRRLLDLEQELSIYAAEHDLSGFIPRSSPDNLFGIEVNIYAHELASVVVWIGYLQWQHDNSPTFGSIPILKPLNNIRHMDAVLAYDANGKAVEPPWPEAHVIIGNPPFLGGKKLRGELGDKYVNDLFQVYDSRVPREADLVTYWFEKARAAIQAGNTKRAGLLATQGIRGGANRRVLEGIKKSGDIFFAYADRDWVLEGATVHVSMIGFDNGDQKSRELDGTTVPEINADLSTATDLTKAVKLRENGGISFMGDTKGGAFDLAPTLAQSMLDATGNPNARRNSDVVRPWINASDLGGRPREYFIIDFGTKINETDAAQYEHPFEYVKTHVKPERAKNKRELYRVKWWIHSEPRPAMRTALASCERYIATPRHSKFRLFIWEPTSILPDSALIVFARTDDYFFGVLHSHIHEIWARRKGTQVREAESGFRYTPDSCFDTFPLPWPPGKEPKDDSRVEAIAAAARDLVRKRDEWLNPAGASAADLKKRTLTNLYNARPQWLVDAHRALDSAVLATYEWPQSIADDDILRRLLELNQQRATASDRSTDAQHA